MLYLAEVHKKTGFMGAKTELKLLARQQSEQNWTMLPGEEMIPVETANEYNSGVLVLVEMDANQQVKKIYDATRHLVGILKNFSRMRDKFRTQEEEIEGWKQSLIYQSQELTRREVDIEARAEELQQLEAESHKIQAQLQEFEETRTQILQLKEEIERDRAQLEEAWGRLHSAQQQHAQEQHATALSDDQVNVLENLIERLEGSLLSSETLSQPLQTLKSCTGEQQTVLQQFWNQLDQERGQPSSLQAELEQQAQDLEQSWQQWHQGQTNLYELKAQSQILQETLTQKQTYRDALSQTQQAQADLVKGLQCLKDGILSDAPIDIEALKAMPLEELEATVDKLQQELSKLSQFVSDQEEELKLQSETIEELKAKIETASEYDRLNLASDLEDEQQNYLFLENTLQGQRQNLKDRDSILKLHRSILNQRKGVETSEEGSFSKQVNPLLSKAQAYLESLQAQMQTLDSEIAGVEQRLQDLRGQVDTQTAALSQTQSDLNNRGKDLAQRQREAGQLQGRVDVLQQALQPIQDQLNRFNQTLDSTWPQFESKAATQQQVAADLKQTIMALGKANLN